ncbi:hypothetical protein CRE_20457 [Caenorhabditis remanei]|uniref:Uncharacterized protein n=1 Tax=Caenorhabditis remanei TaxID=31234 RepID=E3N2U2_CAERE|nr:hypothetical protein CRE_20457 [Caenorhabditis remanei]
MSLFADDFTSLRDTSAYTLASYMLDGDTKNWGFNLEEDLSNLVYENLHRDNKEFTEEVADDVIRKLKLSKVRVDFDEYDAPRCRVLNAQKTLKELELRELRGARDFHDAIISEGTDNELAIVDIAKLLEAIIGKGSGETMRTLEIDGTETLFVQNEYISKIHSLIPKLENLILFSCDLPPREFRSLCTLFTSLKKLDLCDTKISSLDGISNLPNLELLNLAESIFNQRANMTDLFQLRNLKVLNIRAYDTERPVHNFKRYLSHVKSGRTLPELRMIDIGNNYVDLEDIILLIETHPKLEQISLIGTRLQTCSQLELPNRKVELLTLENAHHCFKSVMYCVNTGVNSPLILLKLFDKCDYFMERSRLPTDKDYRECLETMFPLTQYNIPIIRDNAFRCLQCIGWRPRVLSNEEKQRLIQILHGQLIEYSPATESDDEIVWECTWFIFQCNGFLETTQENMNSICQLAAENLTRTADIGLTTSKYCLNVVRKLLRKITPQRALAMATSLNLKSHLVDLLSGQNQDSIGMKTVYKLFKVINALTSIEREKRSDPLQISVDEKCIFALMQSVSDLFFEGKVLKPLSMLTDYVQLIDTSVYAVFFQNFSKFLLPFLLSRKTQKQRRVISLLEIMMCCVDENASRLTGETINEICKHIYEYDRKEDGLKVFEWIVKKCESKEAAEWARWVSARCGVEIEEEDEKEEEPAAKRVKSL